MPKNMIQRGNNWEANLQVPADVKGILKRSVFRESCGTGDLTRAEPIAMQLVAGWKQQIAVARQNPDAAALSVYNAGLEHRAAEEAGEYADERTGMTHADAWLTNYFLDTQPPSKHSYYLNLFAGRTGLPLLAFMEQWIADEYDKPRTCTEARLAVNTLLPHMPTFNDITTVNAQRWVNSETRAKKTVQKAAGFMGSYYKWLVANEKIVPTVNPFAPGQIVYPKKLKAKQPWKPFTDKDMRLVLELVRESGDEELERVFDIARYTGMRLAEASRCERTEPEDWEGVAGLYLREAKTEAGIRWVPIARGLKLPNPLSPANDMAVGKRFGRLIRPHIGDKKKVFHSIRKWCVTKLEQADISEGIAADLVGHEKQTITFGVYSGGSSVKQLKKAVGVLEKANKALE